MADDKYLIRVEASMKIDIDLYRAGNSTSPRLDNVRDKDIVKFKDALTGLTKVRGLQHLPRRSLKSIGGGSRQVQSSLRNL